ncbi:SURF1 family protein [soil metagenome]
MSQTNSRSSRAKLQLFIGKYCFAPTLIPTILTLLLLPFFLSLGFWQLHRAAEKQVMQDNFAARATLPPLQLADISGSMETFRYRVIKIRGHFDNQHTFLLDNKFSEHRLGYQVLSPFVTATLPPSRILVNRGWISMGKSRAVLPDIPAVEKEVSIEGVVEVPTSKHFALGKFTENLQEWPKRVQYLDLAQFANLLAEPIASYIVLLSPASPYGFVREWAPVLAIAPARHIGYAIQWFIFAGILLILFVVLNTKKRVRNYD